MRRREYSFRILNGKGNPAEELEQGYVPLEEGEQYTLLLNNLSDKDAVALITIDGKDIAHVKVAKQSKLKIDSPANSDQKFTFYKKNGEEGKELFEGITKEDLGLIQVQFVEVPSDFQYKEVKSGTQTIYVPYYPWWQPYWRPFFSPWWEWHQPYSITVTPATTYTTINMGHSTTNGSVFDVSTSISGSGGGTTSNAVYTANSSVTLTSVSGGTGLSGMAEHMPVNVEQSREKFEQYIDSRVSVTLKLRLIWKKNKDKLNKPNRLMSYVEPTPPPLD